MEITTTLNNAIEHMKTKREAVQLRITNETTKITELTEQLSSIEQQIDSLTKSVKQSEDELICLNNIISETETGYQKLVQAGETLMSIVSNNLPTFGSTNENTTQLN